LENEQEGEDVVEELEDVYFHHSVKYLKENVLGLVKLEKQNV